MDNWQSELHAAWRSEKATPEQAMTFACWLCDEIGSSNYGARITPELVELAGKVRRVLSIGIESAIDNLGK